MRWFYTAAIRFYVLAIKFAALFNPKAQLWVKGRKSDELYTEARAKTDKWIWVHAASLGEFEQGRPIIELIKARFPEKKILLTFFSPSGYEIRKNYALADKVAYLPADTPKNAKKLLETYAFEAAIFVKYEFWFNFMEAIYRYKVPLYFISARFRKQQHFFKWYGAWQRNRLKRVNHFFVQDKQSAKLLKEFDIQNVTIVGDTRFDRVYQISRTALPDLLAERFLKGRRAFVVGSSWPADEDKLMKAIKHLPEEMAVILAPHDISEKHLRNIERLSPFEIVRYSDFTESSAARILLIDNIGMLSQLYRYAYLAYVGGGFGQNIHNIQEAVAYGCPVLIGPNYGNFSEAVDLVELGGAFAIHNSSELIDIVNKICNNPDFREHASTICQHYVEGSVGATEKIMSLLQNS